MKQLEIDEGHKKASIKVGLHGLKLPSEIISGQRRL
jgi:hypothetical protein